MSEIDPIVAKAINEYSNRVHTQAFIDGLEAGKDEELERILDLLTTGSIEMLDFYGKKILLSPLEAHRGYDSDIDDEQFLALLKGEK